MQRYAFYPTPPSTNEDSPQSIQVSSPSNNSDNSSSPTHHPSSQIQFLPMDYNITPQNFSTQSNLHSSNGLPIYLNIVEQPVDKFRFRYKSEMTGTHGNLNGETSDKTRKMTYPTVELCNYQGTAIVRCSIWQINYNNSHSKPHAHRLVKKRHGKEETDDPHDVKVDKETKYQATFHSMGIIHTAKKNIVGELIKKKTKLKQEEVARTGRKDLNKKEEMEIKGLAEAESKSINLNVVCLRFDAFYVDDDVYFPLCEPVFSHAINNLKSALTGELKIVRMDHCTSPAHGEREIFLLVERVTKKNIKVRFYELDNDDNVLWEDYGKFSDLDVHHQYAIVLRTPPYKSRDISTQVKVFMELVRPSDNAKSEPKEFSYIPSPNHSKPGSKRARPSDFDSSDYDTKSIGSEALPTVLQNISSDFETMKMDEVVNSEELNKALANIDSEEFQRIFDNFKGEYGNNPMPEIENFSTDFPIVDQCHMNKTLVKQYKCDQEELKVQRVYKEIYGFLKTKPSLDAIKSFLRHHMKNSKDSLNAFHLAVINNDTKVIKLFTKLIYFTKDFDLINVRCQKGRGTALHLATLYNNMELVQSLISLLQADVSATDENLNTPLHIAAEDFNGYILEALLKGEKISLCINKENKDNDTPLLRAVKRKNVRAVKLLCKYGANVDFQHPANGYTALRFAIDNKDLQIVRILLLEAGANPNLRDFNEINPLQAAMHSSGNTRIKEEIQNYMTSNNISCDVISVKEEVEEDSSEDEMFIFEDEVKAEPLPVDWHTIYQNVTNFSEECLIEVSKLLDASGKWEDLASLLDLEHLVRMLRGNSDKESPTKYLLNYVVASNGASVKEIRDFLDNLDETAAAQSIDRMVQKMHNSILIYPEMKVELK